LFLVVGAGDLVWQHHRYTSSFARAKQEVREEVKEQQGNPQVKLRIRRIQRDLARRRMMKEIPKATAVIVNPTHYAVAIRYVMESTAAPRVIAKGKELPCAAHPPQGHRKPGSHCREPAAGSSALQFRPSRSGDPEPLYRAVAEILAYIIA